jgi:hypothetical protein
MDCVCVIMMPSSLGICKLYNVLVDVQSGYKAVRTVLLQLVRRRQQSLG